MAMPLSFPCKVDMFHTITLAAQMKKGHFKIPVQLKTTSSAHATAIERRSHQPVDALVKQMMQVVD